MIVKHREGAPMFWRRIVILWLAAAFWCCVRDAGAEYDNCANGTVFDVGNGRCDAALNNAFCGFDGGDCCPCTCVDGPVYSCSDNVFDCRYLGCEDPAPSTPSDSLCKDTWIGDGECDRINNNAICDYDGGDCCECSCVDTPNFSCIVNDFMCKDPACIDYSVIGEFPACTGDWQKISDGSCDAENNLALCGWDGGDCCPCTCSGAACIFSEFDCLDQNAAEERYDCKPPPPAALPCSTSIQRAWVVEDSAAAQNLASVVNCSGGSFEVEWRGDVVIDEPIYVVGGTVLTVTGDESVAVIDGNGSTRLFSVINSTLHISGVNISSGAGFIGGAIVALGSTLTLNRTNLIGNHAFSTGGAVFISDGSSMSCTGVSFLDNRANAHGGAMFVAGNSTASCGGLWVNNSAGGTRGGALSVNDHSTVSWGEETTFAHNAAVVVGGAVHVFDGSSLLWNASTSFVNNTSANGGALAVVGHSVSSWSTSSSFLENKASSDGGAVFIFNDSSLWWSAPTSFVKNTAGQYGGALAVYHLSATSWSASTSFLANEAEDGGAIDMAGSSLSWTGDTESRFEGNRAQYGGVLWATASHISCAVETISLFMDNSAYIHGGALVVDSSNVSFGGIASFVNNSAIGNDSVYESGAGGAVFAAFGSSISWSREMDFIDNSAAKLGGGLYVDDSRVFWSGKTRFVENYAGISGGAVLLWNGSHVGWTGETDFTSNEASIDGGAVGSAGLDSEYNLQGSTLDMNGSTTFTNNTSGANGGALVLSEGLSASFIADGISFTNNRAEVAGGAVFVSGNLLGPVFTGVNFISNFAQVGGAVFSVGSGHLKAFDEVESPNPTTFDGCRFIANRATTTGGAIESAAGQDNLTNSVFHGNRAGVGGALRLAGTTSIGNCSFVENVSDDGGGAAVSNIGSISRITDTSFSSNVVHCPSGMFLDYETGDRYGVICSGCQTTCIGCEFEEEASVPICTSVLDHTNSPGGAITVETLSVERGYWRATTSSDKVLACYNANACQGGVTGTDGYCRVGYEGPYCSVCSDGYTAHFGFTCSKCSDKTGRIVTVSIIAAVAALAGFGVVLYLVSRQVGGRDRGPLRRLFRNIPLQSVKIVIVAWQILTQFAAVANVTYPGVYQRFLDGLDVFNFDLLWVFSAGCIIDVDFHDRLLVSTVTPLIALLFMAGTYTVAVRVNRGAPEALQIIWNKHVSMVLLLTFLVYSSVSSMLLKTYACEDLEDGKNYLRADYRIECDSRKHRGFQLYAGFMIAVYTVGIPAFYGVLLFRDRQILRHDQADRKQNARVTTISDLWKPYKPSAFYYEIIECFRRVLLAGVVVFIEPNTAAQIAVTLMLAFVFLVISEGLAPYASRWDTWLSRTGHAVVFVSMYVALLLKVDVSDDRTSSQEVFEAVLVTAHACMILVVVVETLVLTCSLKGGQRGWYAPRVIDVPVFRGTTALPAWEDNPFADHVYESNRVVVC